MVPILPDSLRCVLIASFPAGPFQANCYLVAEAESATCVVIDPGMEAAAGVKRALEQYRLTPVAVVASHGHLDHVAEAALVADTHDIPVHIHHDDRELLTDPSLAVSSQMMQLMLETMGSTRLAEPRRVEEMIGGQRLELAGIGFDVLHAPGHTPGCVLLGAHTEEGPLTFTGDVLFAGSIGRTDLPRGSMATMVRTLKNVVLGLDDASYILPGHGPATQMAHERANNPYLQPDTLAQLMESDN